MTREKQVQWNSASLDFSRESINMTRQLSEAFLEHGRNLGVLQLDNASIMVSEGSRQFKHWLNSAAYNGDSLIQWSSMFQPRALRFIEIAQGWLDVSSQATAEMNQFLGQALPAMWALTGQNAASKPKQERRRSAQVISFADRRRSAQHPAARGGANESADAQRMRTRTG
jgi:hypothetical protein